jgi:hypothetical protein
MFYSKLEYLIISIYSLLETPLFDQGIIESTYPRIFNPNQCNVGLQILG